jgi:3-methyladenine DNA glycosylase AlkC
MLHPDEHDHTASDSDADGICGWAVLPLTMVVGDHWLDDFDAALEVLRQMTMRFTSEGAVRSFLLADQTRALGVMAGWIEDPNEHVRRLVSEGTRPRLPWAMRLPGLVSDPAPLIPLLTALRDDEEEYVRRSVANSLNDIAKDHPDLVAQIAAEWLHDADKNRERLVRHACRTLIKQGHPGALAAFGYEEPQVELVHLGVTSESVTYGESVEFTAELRSRSDRQQALVLDYVIHFVKANGRTAPKVFKWTKLTLDSGATRSLRRTHPIRPITTRRYYDGDHAVSLRINGRDLGMAGFVLEGSEHR